MSATDLLLFDCGNSTINSAISRNGEFPDNFFTFNHKDNDIEDQLVSYIRKNGIFRAVFVSVVPMLTQTLLSVFDKEGVACIEFCADQCGVSSLYNNPGSDRILFAYSIKTFYPGRAMCLIDAGTALTVDGLDRSGSFLGGFIMPGVKTAFTSIARGAALLSGYELSISHSVGIDTESSFGSGLSVLYSGGLKAAIEKISALCGDKVDVVLTGGDGPLVKELLSDCLLVYDPLILLKGLVVYYYNCSH